MAKDPGTPQHSRRAPNTRRPRPATVSGQGETSELDHPLAAAAHVPGEDEEIGWVNFDLSPMPIHYQEALQAFAADKGCTVRAVLLRLLYNARDDQGRKLFRIRESDLARDGQKTRPSRGGDAAGGRR